MCVFCEVISGKLPSKKVYEDKHTLAFLNIKPDVPEHTLVVPKQHYKNLTDCPPEVLNHVMATVKKLTKKYLQEKKYLTVKVVMNNEPPCQSVPHLHIHILPYMQADLDNRWTTSQVPV